MIATAIWAVIAIVLGVLEALLFSSIKNASKRFKEKFKFDIHLLFTAIRGVLVVLLIWIMNVEEYGMFLFVAALIFPFLHDGFLYMTGKYLSKGKIYKNGFTHQSKTTTAILSFSFFWRVLFFVFGCGMLFTLI